MKKPIKSIPCPVCCGQGDPSNAWADSEKVNCNVCKGKGILVEKIKQVKK